MEFDERKPEEKIHYYSYLPKHIKRMASELQNLKPNQITNDGILDPACVINEYTTVIGGKLNIPNLIERL